MLSRVLGALLVAFSVIAIAQTIRETVLREIGQRAYAETHPHALPFTFAGRTFTVVDDQSFATSRSEAEVDGIVQPLIDGQPLGLATRSRVRPGRGHDLGRYHLWYDATIFQDRKTGARTLWLARRVQPTDEATPHFEVTVVEATGALRTRVLPAWRLGHDFRMFRATQFVRHGTWTTMPFSLDAVMGFYPLLLLLFPVGTFVLGLRLARRRSPASLGIATG